MFSKPLSTEAQAEFFKLVLDSTLEGFYSVDTEGHTTLCNAAFLRLLGYETASEVIGRKLHGEIHHIHPDGSHYEVSDCPIYNAASKGIASYVPYELFYRKDGTALPVEYRALPIHQNGVLQGALCTFTDITDKVAKETILRETQEFTSSIIESSPDCVKVVNRQGHLVSMNEEGCRQMDVDDIAMCINQPWLEFWSGEGQKKARLSFQAALEGATTDFEGFCATMKGVPKWWEVIVSPIRTASGTIDRVLVVSRDITERRISQNKVRELQEHLSLMLDSAADYAIISMDEKANIVIWNNGAQEIFGYSADEVIGKHIELIFNDEDREAGAHHYELSKASEIGRSDDERWHVRKNGERFYASGMMAAMRNDASEVQGYIKIARDMTKRKQAQEALLEARNAAEAANIAKTEFLANMSHEIRTPMNAIIGLSHILSMSKPLTDRQKDCISTLQMSGDNLLTLINDLLDIAKIEARSVELEHIPFSVTQVMQQIVSMMAVQVKDKGLEFTGDGECVKQRMFMGDPTRLRQIITNLCSNAIKFTDQGSVHVSIQCEPSEKIGFETICISVKDTGTGIPSGKLDTIFQKFVQADTSINRKYGGTGLGLAITKTLTEIMGGEISVKSEHGKGSTFAVRIPLEAADDIQVAAASYSLESVIESSVEKKLKQKVLLVEDYQPNVMVAKSYLEHFGYEVDVAGNGHEAVDKVRNGQYVSVLMDVQMHGMNGLDATKLIREHEKNMNLPRIPIIGMTAHALVGDKERCLAVGMDDYLSKPFNPADLQIKLEMIIHGQPATVD